MSKVWMMAPVPSADDLVAYRRGSLSLERFQVVDAWLATLDPEEQVRLLEGEAMGPLPGAEPGGVTFRPDAGHARFVIGATLGRGGMGEVRLAHDQVLDRDVAIKVCRPRAADESLADFAVRLRAFRREASITAQLEHPAIVPIHDAGLGAHGEPAYVMKRLSGRSLDQNLQEHAAKTGDLADTVETLVRIAEAIAHAHQHGIVHRDLKPANVVVGELGAVSVLDWGLAARIGDTGDRAGTPVWMAPEQEHGAPADPRMDVYALGGLLLALLTGTPPRPTGTCDADLSPLADGRVPRGLAALIRACLHRDPTRRPADGAVVAAELRRWLSAGVTAAEQPGIIRRAVMLSRRSPQTVVIALSLTVLVAAAVGTAAWNRHQERDLLRNRLRQLAATPLDDLPAMRSAFREISERFPRMPEADALVVRLQTAIEAAETRAEAERRRASLLGLAARYRENGPWTTEADDLRAALGEAGIDCADPATAGLRVRASPLHGELLAALVQLQRVVLLDGCDPLDRGAIPAIIRASSDAPAWRGLADLLAKTHVEAHDLVLCECAESEAALADPVTADLMLATFGPEARLTRYASERLTADPGAFWPRVISARAAYDAHRDDEARRHALVALGREAHSLWPHLLLAYLALRAGDDVALRAEAEAGLAANPEHLELRLLRAVSLARSGDRSAGESLAADPGVAAHLQYHRQHPHGHPMEHAVAALIAAGVALPDVPPEIGPLVPGGHHH